MVDGRESKKRQEKIFWRFFVSRPAVYRRFGEKLIPMSNDYYGNSAFELKSTKRSFFKGRNAIYSSD